MIPMSWVMFPAHPISDAGERRGGLLRIAGIAVHRSRLPLGFGWFLLSKGNVHRWKMVYQVAFVPRVSMWTKVL